MAVGKKNLALAKRFGAKLVAFRSLTAEAQMALIVYLDEWSGQIDELYHLPREKWADAVKKSLPHFVKEYGDEEFGLATIPIEELKRECYERSGDIRNDFPNFDTYHDWYVREGDTTNHKGSIWPCILSCQDDELFEDGWHRFHSYVRAGAVRDVPVLYFPRNLASKKN